MVVINLVFMFLKQVVIREKLVLLVEILKVVTLRVFSPRIFKEELMGVE